MELVLAVMAVALFVALPVMAADENTHSGKVVSAADGKLVMTDSNNKEMTHSVAADAKISFDGKECKLEDLKKGAFVKVTTKKDDPKVAILIQGSSKEDK
jgi:biopolymer transport protein ExbD